MIEIPMCLIRHILIWLSIAGVTFFRKDVFAMVADIRFETIRVFHGSRTTRNREKLTPISNLASLPNMRITVNTLHMQNKPSHVGQNRCT